jgi:imidazolonepropionase-like amidohydrolase
VSNSWLLISGGTVIDGVSAEPRPGEDVLIQSERIVAVSADPLAEFPEARDVCQVIDATGMTVMPGLIDVHCHMTYGEARTEEEIDLYTSHELRTLIAAANCVKVLKAGVTSISQPGGSYYIGVGLREAVKRGLIQGPRISTAGRYITTSNGLSDWYPDSVGVPQGSIGTLCNSASEMVSEVRHQVKNGVDLIKLADSPYGQYQAFTLAELQAVTEIAHQLHRDVTIHARGRDEVAASVRAGVDWIMHGNIMDEEVAGEMAEAGIPLVPTLLYLANTVDWPHLVKPTAVQWEGCRELLDRTAASLHAARDAGVTFAMGTDTGFAMSPYGEWHAREMELLCTYAGLTPMEAIQAGTRNGARMMGLEGELGMVAPGCLGDVIVVQGDPLANLRLLYGGDAVRHVIKGGVVQQFAETDPEERYHHDRLPSFYAENLLTWQMVSDGAASPGYREVPWTQSECRDVAADIQHLTDGAAEEIPESQGWVAP